MSNDTTNSRTCETCAYAIKVRRTPTSIDTQLSCKRFPPSPIALMHAPGQFQIVSAPTIVAPQDYCHEYDSAPDVN